MHCFINFKELTIRLKMIHPLITSEKLYVILNNNNLVLLDASRKFNDNHTIKGAIHFDIKNRFSDISSALPNTFPEEQYFQEECRKIGINQNSKIVVFDNEGIFTSPRVWFLFKAFGHENVTILDGGLPDWENHHYPVGGSKNECMNGDFEAHFNSSFVTSYDAVVNNIKTQNCLLIDARSLGRFSGASPEPRTHLQSGHITNAINLPYTTVLEDGKFKTIEVLKDIFRALDIEDKPVIFSCGSGITACIILVAFVLVNGNIYSIYDGSWTEWAEKNNLFS